MDSDGLKPSPSPSGVPTPGNNSTMATTLAYETPGPGFSGASFPGSLKEEAGPSLQPPEGPLWPRPSPPPAPHPQAFLPRRSNMHLFARPSFLKPEDRRLLRSS